MKHKWGDMAGLANLGFSGSVLRSLNSLGSALEEAEHADAAIRGAGLGKMGAGLSGVLGGMDGRVRADGGFAGMVARIADTNAALGKETGVRPTGNGVKDISGGTAARNLALGKASRPYAAFDGLPDLLKGASSLSSAFKAADLAGAIPKSTALGLPETMPGADLSAARTGFSFLGAGERADGIVSSAWKSGWKDDLLLSSWKSGLLSGASPGISGLFGTADALKDAGAWRNAMGLSDTDWLYGPTRGLGLLGKSSAAGVLGGTLPAFDALGDAYWVSGRALGGMLDTVGRIDFEAIRRAAEREARVREARRPRTRIGFAALEAYDAFYLGQPWAADSFLVEYLGIEPDEDRREALWRVLRWTFERTVPRPAKWIVLDDERAAGNLRGLVRIESKRVRRDKERPDRVWWEERDPVTKKKVELPPPTLQPEHTLEFMMKSSGDPADVVPPADERGRVLQMLYVEGTEQDRRMVGMLIAGFDLAAIARVVGWPEVQRFTRKAQRWRRIRLNHPPGG